MRWTFSLVSDAAFGLVAAAAEYHDQGKDDDPGAVVVKDMTKAIVVHSVISLRKECSAFLSGRKCEKAVVLSVRMWVISECSSVFCILTDIVCQRGING